MRNLTYLVVHDVLLSGIPETDISPDYEDPTKQPEFTQRNWTSSKDLRHHQTNKDPVQRPGSLKENESLMSLSKRFLISMNIPGQTHKRRDSTQIDAPK